MRLQWCSIPYLSYVASRHDKLAELVQSNAMLLQAQQQEMADNSKKIGDLAERVLALERGDKRGEDPAVADHGEYEMARKSIRLWPVRGATDEEMWGSVEDFLHDTLAIPLADISENDIEDVTRVVNPMPGIKDEVIVLFSSAKVRDDVMAKSSNLAGCVDAVGKPTAGTRIEVPPALRDTFRILHKFGRGIRARHGPGTRRHIKFDDHERTLYANVKLPGDDNWTRVYADMAKRDLEKATRNEAAEFQRRLAAGGGPRERLRRPTPENTDPRTSRGRTSDMETSPPPSRPGTSRWTGRTRGPPRQ